MTGGGLTSVDPRKVRMSGIVDDANERTNDSKRGVCLAREGLGVGPPDRRVYERSVRTRRIDGRGVISTTRRLGRGGTMDGRDRSSARMDGRMDGRAGQTSNPEKVAPSRRSVGRSGGLRDLCIRS